MTKHVSATPKLSDVLAGEAATMARRLLGSYLERTFGDTVARVKIVETEAYDESDVASHSYKGRSTRTQVMFMDAGHLYVYFTYGKHYCCNIVVGPRDYGAAVLIRAVEPISGIEQLTSNRPGHTERDLTNGPAKLCEALAITSQFNGHNLHYSPLKLLLATELEDSHIAQTSRIGLSQGKDTPWRFYVKGNPYISKP